MDYQALIKEHGSVKAAAEAVGMPRSTFRERLQGGRRKKATSSTVVQPSVKGRSLAAFRQEFDKSTVIPAKIESALKALGNSWMYEVDFARVAGLSLLDLGHYRDSYAGHIVIARASGRSERKVWAGTVAMADEMRAML